jgi:hypothetical protein
VNCGVKVLVYRADLPLIRATLVYGTRTGRADFQLSREYNMSHAATYGKAALHFMQGCDHVMGMCGLDGIFPIFSG